MVDFISVKFCVMKEILFSMMTLVSITSGFKGTPPDNTGEELVVTSPVFENDKNIPPKYTCQSGDVQPPLLIQNLPLKTKSVAVVMYDEDGPDGHVTHWIAFNIEPKRVIEENSMPGITGLNDHGNNTYFGPCPGIGTHTYHFQIYALDVMLKLDKNTDERKLKRSMHKHIIGYGELSCQYKKLDMAQY